MNICAREGCEETFVKKTHNQKFHHDDCTKLATNVRLMEKYYERQERRRGKKRLCAECNETQLSRYNNGEYCAACKSKRETAANDALASLFSNTSLVS